MEPETPEPHAVSAASENPLDVASDFDEEGEQENPLSSFQGRHDGWTGQRMAMFCAVLAETGIVTDACIAVGMSTTSAYSARRRNPLFAAAWEESLKLARDRLADALLERSLSGSVEKYYRDGELVGEKRIVDNRLGMQVLRRLDRRAEELGIPHPSVRAERSRGTPAELTPDWDLMLSALRTGDEGMIADALQEAQKLEEPALSLSKGHEVGEVCVAGNHGSEGAEDEEPERCWQDEDGLWWTDFPPPPDFCGEQEGRWGDEDYERECTPEERTEDESLRDSWLAQLRAGLGGKRDRSHDGAAAALGKSDAERGGDDRESEAQPDNGAPPVPESLIHH